MPIAYSSAFGKKGVIARPAQTGVVTDKAITGKMGPGVWVVDIHRPFKPQAIGNLAHGFTSFPKPGLVFSWKQTKRVQPQFGPGIGMQIEGVPLHV